MQQKEKILFGLILLFLLTFYFAKTSAVNVILSGGLVIYSYFYQPFKTKWEVLKKRPHIVAMLLFFGWLTTSLLWSENLPNGLKHLQVRLPLLLFPASIGLLSLTTNFRDKVLLGFAWITFFLCLFCLGNSILLFFQDHRKDIFFNDNLTLLLRQQSIYVALLVNFAIFIFAYFILFRKASYKIFMGTAALFLIVFSYLLASRINFAVLVTATLAICIYYIISKGKVLEGLALLMGFFIGTFLLVKFFPQTLNRYRELTITQFNFENMGKESHFNTTLDAGQWNGANFRLAAWTCGWEVFKENPLTGVGLADKEVALMEKYRQKNFRFAIQLNRNVHNNYLDVLFSTGLVGFFIFFAGWVVLPLTFAYRQRDGLAFLIILTFTIAWLTEVYFSRNFGAMAVAFFIPFLLTSPPTKRLSTF